MGMPSMSMAGWSLGCSRGLDFSNEWRGEIERAVRQLDVEEEKTVKLLVDAAAEKRLSLCVFERE
jgi:hypothetical protein